ncbi:site-specific integrase [Thiorhodococcus mannitoliphagus]|uniref:Site-specific integrase n=2 Tax=Thiorhodococcus mannitoliphagus TaxID=329406 RepID=A0A6P1E1C1_9GAMM|nr:site-specific integrase [Thiorhodococcus mannitoliphagus]
MPKVFTGKVMIPGDKIDEYFQARKEAEEERKPFRDHLESLKSEFESYLSNKYTEKTARKHTNIIQMFIEFLCDYTDVENLEDVTKGMANSHFRKWYHRKVWDSSTDSDIKVAVRKFFQFLESEKNIKNEKALSGLK